MTCDVYNFTYKTMLLKRGRYSCQSNPISASLFAQSMKRENVLSSGKDHAKLIEKRFYRHVPLTIDISALEELMITIIQVDRISVSLQFANRKEEVSWRYKLFTYIAIH